MVVYSTKLSSHNNHLYGNALEALIGAIYLDQGYRKCYAFVDKAIIRKYINLDSIARKEVNFKSALIEWSQKNKLEISFDLIESFIDKDGNPVFQSGIVLLGHQIGIGIGYSKKESQQNAAKMAIKKLRTDKDTQRLISELKKKNHRDGKPASPSKFEELPDETVLETALAGNT
jgi:ribonuclease-3